jgi:predicted nucleic acid-binding protein
VLLVDTSVWSLAFRRDRPPADPEVAYLRHALLSGADIATTGIVVQELLQGIRGPKQRERLVERLQALPTVDPDRHDHVRAAEIHTACRQRGVQLGTIDALLVALCVRHDLTLLSTDRDFEHAVRHVPLRLWTK